MTGRVKRKAALAKLATDEMRVPEPVRCALCERLLGRRIEWHHLVPRSRGGTEVVPLHPICHRTIHACVSNQALASTFADLAVLRGHEDIARFLRWIADKPPDFHAPTRRVREM